MLARGDKDGKLKVLTLVDRLFVSGGAENLALQISMRLDPERFERTLCVSRWSSALESQEPYAATLAELRQSGVRFMGIERRSRAAVWSWRPLVSTLRREGIEILHSHKFGSNVWGAILGTLARTPVVIAHEHTWSFEGRPLRRLLDRELIARRADVFIAVSHEDRRRMIEIEGIDPATVRLIPNGIPPLPAPGVPDMRRELGIGTDDPVIGTVCTLRPQKALDVLIRAASLLVPQFPRLRVLIVGRGEERRALERLIGELGLKRTVMMLGRRSDVPDLLRALDIAVCSSDFEGSPLSVMEYMDAARAVVATRVGGVPDLIEHGVHGLLVEPRDPEALAASVSELLCDPERRHEMGARARERRRREFDIAATVRRLEALYEELYVASARGERNG